MSFTPLTAIFQSDKNLVLTYHILPQYIDGCLLRKKWHQVVRNCPWKGSDFSEYINRLLTSRCCREFMFVSRAWTGVRSVTQQEDNGWHDYYQTKTSQLRLSVSEQTKGVPVPRPPLFLKKRPGQKQFPAINVGCFPTANLKEIYPLWRRSHLAGCRNLFSVAHCRWIQLYVCATIKICTRKSKKGGSEPTTITYSGTKIDNLAARKCRLKKASRARTLQLSSSKKSHLVRVDTIQIESSIS